jgi:carbamoyl-phosphate synthase small subunit
MKGYLILEDGNIYEGERIGLTTDKIFYVNINTSTRGLSEIITSPVAFGQGIVFTSPIMSGFDVDLAECQSKSICVSSVFFNEKLATYDSETENQRMLEDVLTEFKIPGLVNVDTRAIQKNLEKSGIQKGMITSNIDLIDEKISKIKNFEIKNFAKKVSTPKITYFGRTKPKQVAVLDLGVKDDIINNILSRNMGVVIYPSDVAPEIILATRPNGIIISNGPGDPYDFSYNDTIQKICKTNIPVLAIGLGANLVALDQGMNLKPYTKSHNGTNFPIQNTKTGKIYNSSQNLTHYIDNESINFTEQDIIFTNLLDNTAAGIKYIGKNIIGISFNPEANPGNSEIEILFDVFASMINK